ncbi:MAG: hypothetical protein RLY93_02125 [Sumerlaeia bacterium]
MTPQPTGTENPPIREPETAGQREPLDPKVHTAEADPPDHAGSVIWRPEAKIKVFAYPQSPGSASYVFEVISATSFAKSEKAGLSYAVPGVIDLKANVRGEFSSMQVFGQLNLKHEFLLGEPSFEVCNNVVTTYLDRAMDVRWYFADGDELHLAFGGGGPSHWLQLGDNALWLGLREDRLAALVAGEIVRDDLGEKQALWEKSCRKI